MTKTRLIKFRYINIFQQVYNILCYKRLKKTRFLKLILFSSLLYTFINIYRLNSKLLYLLLKKNRKMTTKKNIFFRFIYKLYCKRLKKNIFISYTNLCDFIKKSFNILITKSQYNSIISIIEDRSFLKKILKRYKRLSIEVIVNKFLSCFFIKKKSNIINIAGLSLFLYSNYGISKKKLLWYSKKNKLTIDESILFLTKRLDIFLLSFFPVFHILLYKKMFLDIVINGNIVLDYKQFILKIGDLVSISNSLIENSISSSFFLKFFDLVYIFYSINKIYFHYFFYVIKLIFFYFKNSININFYKYNYYIYKNLINKNSWKSIILFFIKEYVSVSRIIDIFFYYESSVVISFLSKNIQLNNIKFVIYFSLFCKKKIIKSFFLQKNIKFSIKKLICIKNKKCEKTFEMLYILINYLFSKLVLLTINTLNTILNHINLIFNLKYILNCKNFVYNFLFLTFLIPNGYISKKLFRINSLLFNSEDIKVYNELHCGIFNQFFSATVGFYLFESIKKKKNTLVLPSPSIDHLHLDGYLFDLKRKSGLVWTIFQNKTIVNTGLLSGFLQWTRNNCLYIFIYYLPYLLNKQLNINNTYKNKKLSRVFRYNL